MTVTLKIRGMQHGNVDQYHTFPGIVHFSVTRKLVSSGDIESIKESLSVLKFSSFERSEPEISLRTKFKRAIPSADPSADRLAEIDLNRVFVIGLHAHEDPFKLPKLDTVNSYVAKDLRFSDFDSPVERDTCGTKPAEVGLVFVLALMDDGKYSAFYFDTEAFIVGENGKTIQVIRKPNSSERPIWK